MKTRRDEIKAKIVAHVLKTGRCPNYATVGTEYYEGNEIFEEMQVEGTIEWVPALTKTGRRTSRLQVVEKG